MSAFDNSRDDGYQTMVTVAAMVVGAWVVVLAVCALLAWPIGLSAHAVWWLFAAGWGVIG